MPFGSLQDAATTAVLFGEGRVAPAGGVTAAHVALGAPGSGAVAVGHITRAVKSAGKRSAGNPHAPFEVAGAGTGLTGWLVRHSQRKRGVNS